MLDEFSYLPKEKALEIVVENTRRIADECEVLHPLAEEWKSYNPKISGADENWWKCAIPMPRPFTETRFPKKCRSA